MPIYLGNQKIKTLYVGGQKIKEAWTMVGGVLTKVYSAIPPFVSTGMTKSGNQTIAATSISEITGWTPDAGSTVDSNALVPGGSKVSATVSFSMSVYNGGSAQVFSLYLYRNGVQVGPTVTKSVGFNSTDTLTGSQTLTVAPTDRFKLYVSRQLGIDHTVNAGANTYIRIT